MDNWVTFSSRWLPQLFHISQNKNGYNAVSLTNSELKYESLTTLNMVAVDVAEAAQNVIFKLQSKRLQHKMISD